MIEKCSIQIALGLKSNHDGVRTSVTIRQQSSPLTDLFKNLSSLTAEIAASCMCNSLCECFIACEPADGEVNMWNASLNFTIFKEERDLLLFSFIHVAF